MRVGKSSEYVAGHAPAYGDSITTMASCAMKAFVMSPDEASKNSGYPRIAYPTHEAIRSGLRPTRSDSAPIKGMRSTNTARQVVPIQVAVAGGILATEDM